MNDPILSNPQFMGLMEHGFRLTPATLAMKTSMGRWIAAKHLAYISKIVATELHKGNARIIVSMPPRHGKSEFLSVNVPIWVLDRWPDWRIIMTSYGVELSADFSRKARDTILDEENSFLNVKIRDDARSVTNFITHERGGIVAAGVGGPITGKGMNLGGVDDYVKNAEDALSETNRQKVWDWYRTTFYTRLEPNGNIIVTATRWDLDDLIGRLLKYTLEEYQYVRLPAFAEDDDPLGRKYGEPLWPERYDVTALTRIKETLGGYWFDALYQQSPRASMADEARGSKIKEMSLNELPPASELTFHRAWDFAGTEVPKGVTLTASEDPDYTVGVKIAFHKVTGRFIILDVNRERRSVSANEIAVKATAISDGPEVPITLEREPGSAGIAFIDNYKRNILPGFNVDDVYPSGPIEFRASAFIAAVEAGKFYMVKAPWNEQVRLELNSFPLAKHDDIISASAIAYNKIAVYATGPVVWGNLTPAQINASIVSRTMPAHRTLRDFASKNPRGVIW